MMSHPEVVYVPLNSLSPTWIALGGQPAFGKGTFAAFDAEPPTLQCPHAKPPRLVVGRRAKVRADNQSNLLDKPVDGKVLAQFNAGSVFLVLDAQVCGSDGFVWWKVNYNGVIGWTMESDNQDYWLEP